MFAPLPAISQRNGTSIVPLSCPALTTTVASQRPASDCAPAGAATAFDTSNTAAAAKSLAVIPCSSGPAEAGHDKKPNALAKKQKGPESGESFPGLLSAEPGS